MSTEPYSHVLITAYVRPASEGSIVRALHSIPNFPGYSATLARGQGRGKGGGGPFVSREIAVRHHMAIRLEVVAETERAPQICDAIAKAAWTGAKGDGVVFTTPIVSFARVREAHPDGEVDVK